MYPDLYAALLDVVKTSAEYPREEEDSEGLRRRDIAAMAAGALPFAGMIGQGRAIHYNQGKDFGENFNNWRKTLKPGDIILSANREMKDFDTKMVALGTGHPEGYHVAVYAGNGKVIESTPPGGTMISDIDEYRTTKEYGQHAQVLRPNRSRAEMRSYVADLKRRHKHTAQFESAVRKRLHSLRAEGRRGSTDPLAANLARLTKKDINGLAEHYRQVVYDEVGAIKGVLKDAVLPKIRSRGSVQAEAAARSAGRSRPTAPINTSADNLMEALRRKAAKGKDLSKVDPVFLRHGADPCLGSVCSSFAAESLGADKPIVKGKHLRDVLPKDFLRSKEVTPISRLTPQLTAVQKARNAVLRQGPNILRGVTGLGMAGGVYGMTALADKILKPKNDQYSDQYA